MNKTFSATQARKQFFKLITMAGKPGSMITITLENYPSVVMLSQDELEGWQETMEIMSDPELMEDIRQGMEDKKKGKVIRIEDLEKELRVTGLKKKVSKR